MEKKGFFFTLLVFIFFFLVMISVTAWTRIQEAKEERAVISIRISKMNEFSEKMKEDADRLTRIAGANALKSAATYVALNEDTKFLNNSGCLEKFCIYELMYNATIEGKENYTKQDERQVNFSGDGQMGKLIFREWDEQTALLADKAGFTINISRDNIGIYQSDPWNVKIGYNLHMNISDKALDSVFRRDVTPVLVTIPLTNYTYSGG